MQKLGTKSYTSALIVVTGLFFMWGFMTVQNDILIPYLKKVFELNYAKAMLVQFAFFGAYFIGSLIYFIISGLFGDPILRIGYKKGIMYGLLLSFIGSVLFYPAAEFRMYGFFLSALFVLGLGFTLLQIAANPYVAILGSEKTAPSRLNLSQGFNSLGTTIGPIIGGFLIFKYFAPDDTSSADAVVIPYMIFAGMFLLLAILIWISDLPRITAGEKAEKGIGALKHTHLIFGGLAIFMYVGAEVSIGSILISYFELDNIAGLNEIEGSKYVAFYWGGLMIGRFLGAVSLSDMKNITYKVLLMIGISTVAFIVIYLNNGIEIASIYLIFLVVNLIAFYIGKSMANRTLYIFAFVIIALLIITLFTEGQVAMWTVIGIGLFNSIMWSNIFTLSIEGLGKYKSQGSSILVMMILGGAIVPVIQGSFADWQGVHMSFVVPIFCYLYIAFYGIYGYKRKTLQDVEDPSGL